MKQLLAFLLIIGMAFPVMADDDVVVRTISVLGQAHRDVEPNEAGVYVSVLTEGKEMKKVKSENDQKIRKLLSIAKDLDIAEKDIRTQYANIQPQYDYVQNKGRVFRNYQANASVEITVKKLDTVAPLLEELVKEGFEHVNNVQYRLSDDADQKIRDEVKLEAIAQAKQKAMNMAGVLAQSVGAPIAIQEAGAQQPPVMRMQAKAMMAEGMAMASALSPVAPPQGMITIHESVSITFEMTN